MFECKRLNTAYPFGLNYYPINYDVIKK